MNFWVCPSCAKKISASIKECPHCRPTPPPQQTSKTDELINKTINTVNKAKESLAEASEKRKNMAQARETFRKVNEKTTKACPKCTSEIPAAATVCPHCRSKIGTSPVITTVVVGILCLFLLSMCNSINHVPTESERKRDKEYDVAFAAEEGVKRILKSPSSAKFPMYREFTVIEKEDHYLVTSYVDAQNSYGAMLRNNFSCMVMKPNMATICELK